MGGDWVLFDYDPMTGRHVWSLEDERGGLIFRTTYPAQQTIDENREFRNSASSGWKGDWHRVASIPLNVYHDQLAEAVLQDDQKYLSRFLNDSDNRAWRTKEGRI